MKTYLLRTVDYLKYFFSGKFLTHKRTFIYDTKGQLISVIGR